LEQLEVEAVVALLRIGDKYIIPELRKEAVSRICTPYSSKLDEYTTTRKKAGIHGMKSITTMNDLVYLTIAAYECRVYSALPALYLECSMEACADLVSGFRHGSRIWKLPADVAFAIMRGKESLMQDHVKRLYS
jgi:hypothetical protein